MPVSHLSGWQAVGYIDLGLREIWAGVSIIDAEIVFEMWLGLPENRKLCRVGGEERAWDKGRGILQLEVEKWQQKLERVVKPREFNISMFPKAKNNEV